jgi:hypothetical protein
MCPVSCRQDPAPPLLFANTRAAHRVCSASAVGLLLAGAGRLLSCGAGEALVRGALLRLPDFDAHLAAAISGRSPAATELAVHLLKAAVQDANPPLAGPDLPASVDVSPDRSSLLCNMPWKRGC